MAINTTSPLYDLKARVWRKMRDCYAGSETIKQADSALHLSAFMSTIAVSTQPNKLRAQNYAYLPPTAGMVMDGMMPGQAGYLAYEAYKTRAVFHDFVKEAVESYVGLLHQKPAVFELPPGMEDYILRVSDKGESLQQLLRRINEEQLVTGRLGLLVDLPETPDPANPKPYVTMYKAETVINWDDSDNYEDLNRLSMVILNESCNERQEDYIWKYVEKFRILQMMNDAPEAETAAEDSTETAAEEDEEVQVGTTYKAGLFYQRDSVTADPTKFIAPMVRGQPLDYLPFVFINSKDTNSEPDAPPLEGLADLCLTMYRGEADYRQSLYMQGQDTLVISGSLIRDPADAGTDAPLRVGAGQRINVDLNGRAEYIGVSSLGLPEQRTALENDKKQASERAGKLIAPAAGKQESGDALSTRMAAQTATLNSIALSGAAGLERALKMIAKWLGKDETKVKVIPNLEFADFLLDGKAMVEFMTARTMGLPLSKESIHGILVNRAMTEMTFEEETAKIRLEDEAEVAHNISLGLNPDGSVIIAPKPLSNDTLGTASGAPAVAPKPGNAAPAAAPGAPAGGRPGAAKGKAPAQKK